MSVCGFFSSYFFSSLINPFSHAPCPHPSCCHHRLELRAKQFYTQTLGLRVVAETYRETKRSHKLDLALPDGGQLELFSFPAPGARPSYPEACGLRHLAFAVVDLAESIRDLAAQGVSVEPVRVDELTGMRFTFFADPDGLPLELYECP